mmetsp:Transcript_40951/g.104750  ORF Transcript_40951/g.104750 Transcript_40951/m.104750 type:complete len:241 (+) Transcript_40951:105-827(+)
MPSKTTWYSGAAPPSGAPPLRWCTERMSRDSACATRAMKSCAVRYRERLLARCHACARECFAPSRNDTDATNRGSSSACACTHPGAVAPGHESQNATYGLTSSTGLPSTMSAPPTTRQPFPTDMISATLRPMGLGRCGVRVASTPMRSPLSRGTPILALMRGARCPGCLLCAARWCRSVLQWKMYMTQQWLYCSRPSRQPGGTPGASCSRARARGTSSGCRGVPFLWLKQDRSTPMGCIT